MATIERVFNNAAQARIGIEQLRGMDISEEAITITEVNEGGEGGRGGVLVTAEVPDGQKTVAQALLDRAAAQDVAGGGEVSNPGSVGRADVPDDRGAQPIAAGGVAATGIVGPAVTDGLGMVVVVPSAGVIASRELTDDAEERTTSGNYADTPGTFSGGGATDSGTDRPMDQIADREDRDLVED